MTGAPGKKACSTFRIARARDERLVADIQVYLRLHCRRRALIEIAENGVAVHFEQASDAFSFAEVWALWTRGGSVPEFASSAQTGALPERPNY